MKMRYIFQLLTLCSMVATVPSALLAQATAAAKPGVPEALSDSLLDRTVAPGTGNIVIALLALGFAVTLARYLYTRKIFVRV